MKKILLLLFSIILWNCTDYVAEWDEKYLAESSDPENSNPFQTSSAGEEKMTEPSLSSSSQDMVLVDPRDGQSYRLVTIGDQVWMAENLNYETMDSYCYDNEPVDCALYGRLYVWEAALDACPSGWHLPNQGEFQELLDVSGGIENLKAGVWNGTDLYGFSALPAGKYDAIAGGSFTTSQMQTGWWLQSESSVASHAPLYAYNNGRGNFRKDDYVNGFSVRCLKD